MYRTRFPEKRRGVERLAGIALQRLSDVAFGVITSA
jgi:hypothetical protein